MKVNKARKTTSKCHYCRVRAPPVELDEYKQSKTLPLTIGFRALLYLNTLHVVVEPVPRRTMYILDSVLVSSTAVSVRPPLPPSSFPLLLFLASTVAWIGQLLSASVLCHFIIKRPAASTTPRYQFPPFLADLDHSALFTPNSKGGLSVDPSVALNAYALISLEIGPSSFLVGLVPGCPHTSHRPGHNAMGQPLRCRPLYGSCKDEVAFAGGRCNALTLC